MHGVAGHLEKSAKANYRQDIDGLRAVAVLSVIAFHYGAPLPGGFTGVDVFFVISGFLITQQLYADIQNGTFSLISFYDRRFRRIVPALLVVVAASLVAGYFLLVPGDYRSLGASATAAAIGTSNFYFMSNTGYFDQAADLMPLLHTWSLGVEEQYYVIGPLVLLAMISFRSGRYLTQALSALVIFGFITSVIWLAINQKSAFYMVAPRSWELGLGALLVFLPKIPERFCNYSAIGGVVLIVCGFLIANPNNFPGVAALLPCAGAALLIWPRITYGAASKLIGRLSPIGLISYSLYLWHWPIFVFFRIYINQRAPSSYEAIVLCAVSIGLAYLSYRLVERPIRRMKWRPAVPLRAGLVSCSLIAAAAFAIVKADGVKSRFPDDQQPLMGLETMWDWPCDRSREVQGLKFVVCGFGKPWDKAKTKALLWGDSHAEHMSPLLEAAAKDLDVSFALYPNCPAIYGGNLQATGIFTPKHSEQCRQMREDGIKVLNEDKSINLVILASSWTPIPDKIAEIYHIDAAQALSLMKSELEELIRKTETPGRRYILIGSVPQLNQEIVSCNLNLGLPRKGCASSPPIALPRSASRTDGTDSMLRDIKRELPNVDIVLPSDRLCPRDTCNLSINGEFIYRDVSHIRRNLRPETRDTLAEVFGFPVLLRSNKKNMPRAK